MALAHALRQHRILKTPPPSTFRTQSSPAISQSLTQPILIPPSPSSYITSRDVLLSYDIACGYNRNLISRFQSYIPDMVEAVSQTRYLIPAVHIQNHQENCMYDYSAAYTPSGTHFHGETAEQTWIELNALGPQTRQMNNGHRQDCIIDSHNDWNWKKTAQIHSTLMTDLIHAREVYFQHRLHFQALTKLHFTNVAKWDLMDRTKRTTSGKDVECVYRRSHKTIPSQKALFEALTRTTSGHQGEPNKNPLVAFVNEGIDIQRDQHNLCAKHSELDFHPSSTLEKEVIDLTSRLRQRLDTWRTTQLSVAPLVSEFVTGQIITNPTIFTERLFISSDFSKPDQTRLELDELGIIESELREGVAFDMISTIQQFVKAENVLWSQKQTHSRGQDQNTRSLSQITRIKQKKKSLIALYNSNRASMIALGLPQDSRSFPILTEEDTKRVSVDSKRSLGASRQFDGAVWSRMSSSTSLTTKTAKQTSEVSTNDIPQASKKQARLNLPVTSGKPEHKTLNIGDGWIWRLGSIGNLTAAEIQTWEEEGDRVHWFRAEAEMERWREQWELKLIEFIRCAAYFLRMSEVWSNLSVHSLDESHRTYARKRAIQFRRMHDKVRDTFQSSVIQGEEPTSYIDGEVVADFILRHRREELTTNGQPSYIPRIYCVPSNPHRQNAPL